MYIEEAMKEGRNSLYVKFLRFKEAAVIFYDAKMDN